MSEGNVNPLGVSGKRAHGDAPPASDGAQAAPTRLDRRLAKALSDRLDASRVRVTLWDTPAGDTGGLPVTVRFGDRRSLFHFLMNPAANFGDLYSAGRISVDGDLLVVLDEAFRSRQAGTGSSRWLTRRSAGRVNEGDCAS